jgi:hypothetical protein
MSEVEFVFVFGFLLGIAAVVLTKYISVTYADWVNEKKMKEIE